VNVKQRIDLYSAAELPEVEQYMRGLIGKHARAKWKWVWLSVGSTILNVILMLILLVLGRA
jgi:hypothetical protein